MEPAGAPGTLPQMGRAARTSESSNDSSRIPMTPRTSGMPRRPAATIGGSALLRVSGAALTSTLAGVAEVTAESLALSLWKDAASDMLTSGGLRDEWMLRVARLEDVGLLARVEKDDDARVRLATRNSWSADRPVPFEHELEDGLAPARVVLLSALQLLVPGALGQRPRVRCRNTARVAYSSEQRSPEGPFTAARTRRRLRPC